MNSTNGHLSVIQEVSGQQALAAADSLQKKKETCRAVAVA